MSDELPKLEPIVGDWAALEPTNSALQAKKSDKIEEADVLSAKLSETQLSGADKPMDEQVDVQNVASLLKAPASDTSKLDAVRGLVAEVGLKGDAGLAAQQADPNSPLYAACSFEDLKLPADILRGVYAMKFVRPSAVQARALPILLSNPPQNVIAQSQSGTGKTAAFVLTMLCRVDAQLVSPQALCLTPARELARQIVDVVREMARFTSITVAAAVREEEAKGRVDSAPLKAHVIVGTPGTVLDLLRRGTLDARTLKVLVFDEADVMFEKDGMGSQSVRVRKACPQDIQTLLFSATFTDPVLASARRLVPHAHLLALQRDALSVDAIRQFYMSVQAGASERLRLLSAIYGLLTLGQSIIFAGSRDMADRIQAHMQLEGFQTAVLHGGLPPTERDSILDAFRSGLSRVLIATNVLARGIDIPQVSLVVNFDMPFTASGLPDPETYLHRIGRTGRFGRPGVSINFISDERARSCQEHIKAFFNRPINEIATHDLETLDKQLNEAS